jgi:hypothetical protein
MRNRARDRAGLPEVHFRDLRTLGATDAGKAKTPKEEIRKRLTHTTIETCEIYIKEVAPETSELNLDLPW